MKTIQNWRNGLTEQQDKLESWVVETLPRTMRMVGAWIEREFGIVYQSGSGPVALLHRP